MTSIYLAICCKTVDVGFDNIYFFFLSRDGVIKIVFMIMSFVELYTLIPVLVILNDV